MNEGTNQAQVPVVYVHMCMSMPLFVHMYGWTDGRMDGWTDGSVDGWIDVTSVSETCENTCREEPPRTFLQTDVHNRPIDLDINANRECNGWKVGGHHLRSSLGTSFQCQSVVDVWRRASCLGSRFSMSDVAFHWLGQQGLEFGTGRCTEDHESTESCSPLGYCSDTS